MAAAVWVLGMAMGAAPAPRSLSVSRFIPAPAEVVWDVLVDLRQWPRWGPSVRRAELRDGTRLRAGARGTVWTAAGVPLPFTVTEFEPGRRWGWAVAGVAATGHAVTPADGGCRASFEVPWWAPGYLAVCAVALRRIDAIATGAASGPPD